MATYSIPLPAGAWMPTSDAASWNSAQMRVKQSSSAVPSPRWVDLIHTTPAKGLFIIPEFG